MTLLNLRGIKILKKQNKLIEKTWASILGRLHILYADSIIFKLFSNTSGAFVQIQISQNLSSNLQLM